MHMVEDSAPAHRSALVVFLGGADLEMVTIGSLALACLDATQVRDKHLTWGARASAYASEIAATIENGRTPVLIELTNDLGPEIDRTRLIEIDHHNEAAGADAPSSLRQLFNLLGALGGDRPLIWTRHFTLVEANDIGHIQGLRAVGATDAEIADIRAADRRAQGITLDVERRSLDAIASRQVTDNLTIIKTDITTASAITDFLDPALGGPGFDNLLVEMPGKLAFYGAGRVIDALRDVPGCWYGGALPDRGFWGCAMVDPVASKTKTRIIELARETAR